MSDIIPSMNHCGINDSGTRSTSARIFNLFPQLPGEIRLQIIRAAIGDRVIHITQRRVNARGSGIEDEEPGIFGLTPQDFELINYRCMSGLTDEALQDDFLKPVVFKNRIDWHMRPRMESRELVSPHDICTDRHNSNSTSLVDVNLFAVAREIRTDALRIFYSTNTFSFSSAVVLGKWLGVTASPATPWLQSLMPPHGLKDCIKKLRFESEIYSFPLLGSLRNEFDPRWLAQALELLALPVQLPNMTSLHLSTQIYGYVTCFRKSRGTDFEAMFRPLRQMKKLKTFTLVILDQNVLCPLDVHDPETHEKEGRETFYVRREIRQTWAQEIKHLVMSEEN